MNALTKVTEKKLETRFRILAQELNLELGFRDQRLRFRTTPTRTGTTAWRLENTKALDDERVAGIDVTALLASATHDASALFFAYGEEWNFSGNATYLFKSSNLRFVVASADDGVPVFRFRLEWASAIPAGKAFVYPGKGAAHPHWQFDLAEDWFPAEKQGEVTIQLEQEAELQETISLNNSGNATAPSMSRTLSSFHRLHLPARAMWHEILCEMPDQAAPQQHSPAEADEIDRWLKSALRYVKHEFSIYT